MGEQETTGNPGEVNSDGSEEAGEARSGQEGGSQDFEDIGKDAALDAGGARAAPDAPHVRHQPIRSCVRARDIPGP